jgi:membrane protease YdiL (CAAX protease family)
MPTSSAGRIRRFAVVAYAVSWAAWAPLVRGRQGGAWGYLHLLGAIGPAVGAFVATAREGRAALGALVDHLLARPRWRWLALAVLGPCGLYLVAAVVLRLAGQPWPRWQDLGASREYVALPRGLYWIANIVFYGFGEEIGWRGYLLPRLQSRFGPLRASVLVTVFWALWHLPLFWFAAGMSAMGAAEVAGWLASLLTGSFLMTYLWNASRGSLLVVALFHGVLDIVMTTPAAQAINVMGAVLTILGILCLIPLWRQGRRREAGRGANS